MGPSGRGRGADAAHLSHLVRRFLGSLWPGGPPVRDERWARDHLLPGEIALWDRMSGPDRRHAVGVARRAIHELTRAAATAAGAASTVPPAGAADRGVVAAALLHDVGKVEAGIGPFRRAIATVAALAAGHERARRWRERPGPLGRIGRYLSHDSIGADLLRRAGSEEVTIRWAREHHLPADRWSVPPGVGAALKAADDD